MERLLLLSSVSLLNELEQEELDVLDKTVTHTEVARGKVVQRPGETRSEIVFIKKGKLRIYRQTSEGKEFTVGLLGEGNVFGDVQWFGLGTESASIDVFEDAVICTLSEKRLQLLIEDHPQLSLKFMKILTDQLRRMEELVTVMAIGSLRWKILFMLNRLADDFGQTLEVGWKSIELRVSHQDIAAMTGATRESVTRVIQDLVHEGIVQSTRAHFSINMDKVSQELHES